MEMVSVKSSNIKAIGFEVPEGINDESGGILAIEFLSGGLYHYYAVPREIHGEMMAAKSQGKFFHASIKGQFDMDKVED